MDVAGMPFPPPAYAGDVTSAQCWQMLADDAASQLIDVRTAREWAEAIPDLSALGKQAHCLSWRLDPDYALNAQFMPALRKDVPAQDTPLFFLCKVGGRSAEAASAVAAQGYTHCFNIVWGFEGEPDTARQRGKMNGWKAEGLPWVQA